jgi:hypothetical protein
VVQEAQRIVQHGILKTEIEEYTKALLADGEQLARSIDTQPHIDMMNLAIETISNKQVLNSNIQAQEVRCIARFFSGVFYPRCVLPLRIGDHLQAAAKSAFRSREPAVSAPIQPFSHLCRR